MSSINREHQRLVNSIGIGTTTAASRETAGIQALQVRLFGAASAMKDPVPSLQQPGFASSPMPGANVVVVHLGGHQSKAVIVAIDDPRHRPTDLAGGEAKMYGASGAFIHIDAGGGVTITPNGAPVKIVGDLQVTGSITAGFDGGDAVGLQTHTHAGGPPPDAGT